jgi:peroxiredoxin Q/BCP
VPASPGSGLDRFDVVLFAASCDPPEVIRGFAQALKLDYPILSDPGKQVAEAYGVVHDERPVPERWTFFIGKDGRILHISKDVDTASHGAEIAAKLEELGIPLR